MTIATHIIWTTYGTWLPGDPRGHWSPLFDMYGRLRAAGHQLNISDPVTHDYARSLMTEPPKYLSQPDAEITADVINKILGGIPVGRFTPGKPGAISKAHALAIESNHVHLLIGSLDADLEATVGRMKGVSSSLILDQQNNLARKRTWTGGFWRVFLYDNLAVETVYAYIINHNIRANRLAHPYTFTHPI
jgi:hypothetical protein